MTPEGKIKRKVKQLLDNYEGRVYVEWPVPHGYGSPSLDAWGAIHGTPFAIETKRPGGKPTPRQETTMEKMNVGGITTFVVSCDAELMVFARWLEVIDRAHLSALIRERAAEIYADASDL
jgi:hypothetical protein